MRLSPQRASSSLGLLLTKKADEQLSSPAFGLLEKGESVLMTESDRNVSLLRCALFNFLIQHIEARRFDLRRVKHVGFAFYLWRDGFLLRHLRRSFKHSALLDDQRRRLNVAVKLRGATEFDALRRHHVTIHDSLNRGHRDLDIRIDLPARADNQRAASRGDAARELSIDSQHRFES